MADLAVRVGGGRFPASRIMGPPAVLLVAVLSETLHILSNTVTRAWEGSGVVTFLASAGHATVTNYTARLRVSGNPTVVDTSSLGVPTPDGNGLIQANLATFFGTQAPGTYTISILATDAGGSTDSEESSPFTLPLP